MAYNCKVCPRSFPKKYNRDRHELQVHGRLDDVVTESHDSEPPKKRPNPSEDPEEVDTESNDSEDEDAESNDSEPLSVKNKSSLSASESEEDSDEEQDINKYDLDIGNQLIEMAGEEGNHVKAMLKLLDTFHRLKKSIIYERIRNAARHFDDIDHLSRNQLMRRAIAFRVDDIDEIVRRCLGKEIEDEF